MANKNIAKVILAILIGVIFLSSYLTLSSLNPGSGSTSTSQSGSSTIPQTIFATATANAMVTGYNNTMATYLHCKNSTAISTKLNSIISSLEQNNSIYNSYSVQNETLIEDGTSNTLVLYSLITNPLNATANSCISLQSSVNVLLPQTLNMSVQSQAYTAVVPSNMRSYSIPIVLSNNNPSVIKVKISALVTQNGTIYSMNVSRIQ